MIHQRWPHPLRQRTSSILMMILVATGCRRWLCRPWQWSLRGYTVIVAVCAAGLVLRGSPTATIVFFTILSAAVYACLSLARYGLKLVDIITLLAMIIFTAAIMLTAMERTRSRTLGKRFFPSVVPANYSTLFSGSDDHHPSN